MSLRGVRQQLYGCDGNTAEEHQEEAKVCELLEREVQGQQDKSVASGAPTETCSEVSTVHPLPTGIYKQCESALWCSCASVSVSVSYRCMYIHCMFPHFLCTAGYP